MPEVIDKNNPFGGLKYSLGIIKILKFAIKYAKENKCKIIFPLKRDKLLQKRIYDDSDSQLKKQLTKNEYNFFISNSSEKNSYKYSSYFSVFQSQLTIASSSTMLKERLGTGGKVLACNYTNLNFNDFPVKGICFLKKKRIMKHSQLEWIKFYL